MSNIWNNGEVINRAMNHKGGHVKDNELTDFLFKHFWHGKMTFLHWNKGEEMAPIIAGNGATLLVRRIPIPDPR
ncbi:mitochondrial inner membrane protease subunit 1-like protein [Trifolium pratense]|uniref:Mitochondrial inner membrane protease subunit 1-like protein n=1 Tax=Trifolium pratense TaxID=57577 RepID=A0A2K3L914_TRIPR|nr:mitochondrial inner membrane protease subunit 1-like protein [Trifolium pratense]